MRAFRPPSANYLPHAKCIDAAQNWTIRPLLPYPDLLARQQTAREAMAAQVDRGMMDPGTMNRLAAPEDQPLTLASTTLDGPLSRQVGATTYAPITQPVSGDCSPTYGFNDCSQ